MTLIEIQKMEWAENNIPKTWDFRNKTADDMAALCFGCFSNTTEPEECKILYGGEARAQLAVLQLARLGIWATVIPPTDGVIKNEEGRDVVIGGWAWSVIFRFDNTCVDYRRRVHLAELEIGIHRDSGASNKWTKDQLEAQLYTIRYLIDVAAKTDGAKVWHVLFSEVQGGIARDIDNLREKK